MSTCFVTLLCVEFVILCRPCSCYKFSKLAAGGAHASPGPMRSVLQQNRTQKYISIDSTVLRLIHEENRISAGARTGATLRCNSTCYGYQFLQLCISTNIVVLNLTDVYLSDNWTFINCHFDSAWKAIWVSLEFSISFYSDGWVRWLKSDGRRSRRQEINSGLPGRSWLPA